MYSVDCPNFTPLHTLAVAAILSFALISCNRQPSSTAGNGGHLEPVYDKDSGRLSLLKYDSDGDGKIDTWSYMDGPRVVRIEIDKDEDGKIDRWEYYDDQHHLTKVGSSRANDGVEDSWSYPAADGSIERVEISTARDGKVTRIEFYEKGQLVRAEEDTNGDGKPDKWEAYDGKRLASVAYDVNHVGRPERRLVYAADGSVRVEVAGADGQFVPAPQQTR